MHIKGSWLTMLDSLRRTERFPAAKSERDYTRQLLSELIAELQLESRRADKTEDAFRSKRVHGDN